MKRPPVIHAPWLVLAAAKHPNAECVVLRWIKDVGPAGAIVRAVGSDDRNCRNSTR